MTQASLENHSTMQGATQATLPLVSVGLPTFNRALSLGCAIQSVLSQDYPNLELIISDNASTDSTQLICVDFSKRDGRVRYIRQPTNQGAGANFRTVLTEASGQYFM
jgi:glycosyltransferase involved in cell wall biosynthesis